MSDLHPNWQPTDSPPEPNGTFGQAEERPLPVRVVEHNEGPPPTAIPRFATAVSRQPAAIAGILLVVTIGLTIFLGSDGVESNGHTVHIGTQGFTPQRIEVDAGERITWVNDSTTTHILQSDDLCSNDRHCLVTQPIAPNASTSVTITDSFVPGTSTYYSISVQGLTGTVTVLPPTGTTPHKAVADAPDNANLQAALPYGDLTPDADPSASSSTSSRATGALAETPPDAEDDSTFNAGSSFLLGALTPPAGGQQSSTGLDDLHGAGPAAGASHSNTLIPMNPYTVGSNKDHPFDAAGNPLPAGSSSSSKAKTTLHGGAPTSRPISQPATGAGTALVILTSIGMLTLFKRKELTKAK